MAKKDKYIGKKKDECKEEKPKKEKRELSFGELIHHVTTIRPPDKEEKQ